MENPKKAFGYCRCSGKGQVNGDTWDRQEKAIKDYALSHGVEVVKFFRDEGVTGTTENRPALAELIVSMQQNGHGVRTVIIEKMDRLARDLMVQEIIIGDFKKEGFELISAHEGEDLLSEDPTRKLVRQVLGAIAEYDKTMTVLKLRAARERIRIRKGKCEGRKGYRDLQDREYHAKLLQEIKRLRRKPKGLSKRLSYKEIADQLNRSSFVTASGVPFNEMIIQNLLR